MPTAKKKPETKFLYAVGHPRNENDPSEGVAFYYNCGEIHHGTLKNALNFRDYCNSQEELNHKLYKRKGKPSKYRVYQVVEVPGSETYENP
jgi:hypothetical protein